ncbi:hydrogenase expression protein HypA [Photobacterium halotolerans]|uniref:Hydrogenase expression protein HypA n=1 Tax=Photobacterium halotolerans TaxID=265726 RepID=A0A7X4WBR1_9GAMM|nr:hydrogenase expression protein HypA [Photobacterium halotolerans]NAW65856.1 hydrogenase expression protein HypA [Photobacterium halotolerans]NAW86163.1 hydrogenase expression protein HypA [Photobacterium halotolerans]
MRTYLRLGLSLFLAGLLSACGGGGDEAGIQPADLPPVKTKFTVTVDLPAGLMTAQQRVSWRPVSQAYAATPDLYQDNFAVLFINQQGKVMGQGDITSFAMTDGNYSIEAQVPLLLHGVLVLDLNGVPQFAIGDDLPTHLFMTPLTDTEIALSLKTTLAYRALIKRVATDGHWGIFNETVSDPSNIDVRDAGDFVNELADELSVTLVPKLGLNGVSLSNLMSLSIVNDILEGIMTRKYTELTAQKDEIATIFNSGFWRLASHSSNTGSTLEADMMDYNSPDTATNETRQIDWRWTKNGDSDISLTEDFTYLSEQGLVQFDSKDDAIKGQILTSTGWKDLYEYFKVLISSSSTAIMTDAGLEETDGRNITMRVNSYSLAGLKMHDFLTTKENHFMTRYVPAGTTFGEAAKGYYFTWNPDTTRMLLCNAQVGGDKCTVAPRDNPTVPYTSLEDMVSVEPAGSIEQVNGYHLTDNVVVELVLNNTHQANYWVNVGGDDWIVVETGIWGAVSTLDKEMFQFTVPDVIKQLANHYPFDTPYLFLVVEQGAVHQGEAILKDTDYHFAGFNNAAKEEIYAVTSRDNLPPFGDCNFGNTSPATEDQFLNSVTECGGDERFVTDSVNSLVDQHLVQISTDPSSLGELETLILKSDNTWEYYLNTVLQPGSSNRSWQLNDNGFLRLTENSNDTFSDYQLWALTHKKYQDRPILAVKYFSQTDIGGANTSVIDNLMTKQYAPDTLVACTANDSGWNSGSQMPATAQTKAAFTSQAASCTVSWEGRTPRFTQSMLAGKALTFSDTSRHLVLNAQADSQSGFNTGRYRDSDGCGFDIPIRWKLEADGTLYYENAMSQAQIDETFSNGAKKFPTGNFKEWIKVSDTDGLVFTVKGFNHFTRWQSATPALGADDGEMWSDVVALIPAANVPTFTVQTPTEAPLPDSPFPGTVLRDGQTCDLTPPAPPAP